MLKGWATTKGTLSFSFEHGSLPREAIIDQMMRLYKKTTAKSDDDAYLRDLRSYLKNRGLTFAKVFLNADGTWKDGEGIMGSRWDSWGSRAHEFCEFYGAITRTESIRDFKLGESVKWSWEGKGKHVIG